MRRRFLSIIILLLLFITLIAKFTFAWELILQGEARERYDDNITSLIGPSKQDYISDLKLALVLSALGLNQGVDAALLNIVYHDKIKYDFISELMATLGVHHDGKTYSFDIMAHVREQIYARYFGLTNSSTDATMVINKAFSELVTLMITDRFEYYPEPDRFDVLFGNTQGRMRYWNNIFNLNSTVEVTSHYKITVAYTNQFTRYFYEHPGEYHAHNILNNNANNYINQNLKYSFTQTARMQQELQWDSSNNIYVFYEYQWNKQNLNGIFQTHRPGVGYRHDFTKQFFIEGRVAPDISIPPHLHYSFFGYDFRQFIGTGGSQRVFSRQKQYYINPYFTIMLSHDVDKKTNARFSFTYQNSIIANNADLTENFQISGDISRQIIDKLALTGSAFYGQSFTYIRQSTNRLFGFTLLTEFQFHEHVFANISYNFTYNYTQQGGNHVSHNYVYYNGVYVRKFTGYMRNQVSIGVRAEL